MIILMHGIFQNWNKLLRDFKLYRKQTLIVRAKFPKAKNKMARFNSRNFNRKNMELYRFTKIQSRNFTKLLQSANR